MSIEIDINKEKTLILRMKQNERSAFDELVCIYQNKGFAIAYNFVGNPEDAKDVLQEAFIKVYLNIKKFKEEAKFSTWFYRIVVNCSLDFLRRKKTMCKVFTQNLLDEEDKVQEFEDKRYEPGRILMNEELSIVIDNSILELPEKQKVCFILKHQNGLSNQEIAQALKCTISTVKVHLFRAVRNLQEKLSGYLKTEGG